MKRGSDAEVWICSLVELPIMDDEVLNARIEL
jgi:hypothetical protein